VTGTNGVARSRRDHLPRGIAQLKVKTCETRKLSAEDLGVRRNILNGGPVPINPKVHVDLIDGTITDAADREKIFSTNTLVFFRLKSAMSPAVTEVNAASAGAL
jgi:hypothetical protein